MIIGLKDIQKSFGVEEVLKNVTFTLEEKEKAALIGVNGAGKSTLFKIITGEMSCDAGEIFLPKTAKVGYFSQSLEIDSEKSIYDELLTVFDEVIAIEDKMRALEQEMSSLSGEALERNMQAYSDLSHELEQRNGYEYQSRIRGVIKGLGFDESEFYKPIRTLSGGQKTRVALGRLLLSMPDLLLLDEPFTGVDVARIISILASLRRLNFRVFLTAHEESILALADRVIALESKG